MLDRQTIELIAQELEQSEQTGQQARQVSLRYPEMCIEDSYAIQTAWVDLKCSQGRRIRGHKVGLTSRAMQLSSNIDEPDFGVLLDDMFYGDCSKLPINKFIVPRVEVELAFVLAKDLSGPGLELTDVYDATSYIQPALEIIDARFHQVDPQTGVTRKVLDTIADNAANAAVVLGGRPVRLHGQIEETGLAAGVLNHPANGVLWLANRLGTLGVGLKAGQVILSGSFTRPVWAKAGDVFHADYGPLGAIQCQFTEQER